MEVIVGGGDGCGIVRGLEALEMDLGPVHNVEDAAMTVSADTSYDKP